jgi:hypothetical protein
MITYYSSSPELSSNLSLQGKACPIKLSNSQYIHVIANVALSKSFSLFFQFFSIALFSISIPHFKFEKTSTIILIFPENSSLERYL